MKLANTQEAGNKNPVSAVAEEYEAWQRNPGLHALDNTLRRLAELNLPAGFRTFLGRRYPDLERRIYVHLPEEISGAVDSDDQDHLRELLAEWVDGYRDALNLYCTANKQFVINFHARERGCRQFAFATTEVNDQ